MGKKIKLIIGLSNEGPKYKSTYHSIGRFFIDQFQIFNLDSSSFGKIEFFLPGGFMNNIGQPILEFLKNKPITSEEVLIIHDESDLVISTNDFNINLAGGGPITNATITLIYIQ